MIFSIHTCIYNYNSINDMYDCQAYIGNEALNQGSILMMYVRACPSRLGMSLCHVCGLRNSENLAGQRSYIITLLLCRREEPGNIHHNLPIPPYIITLLAIIIITVIIEQLK